MPPAASPGGHPLLLSPHSGHPTLGLLKTSWGPIVSAPLGLQRVKMSPTHCDSQADMAGDSNTWTPAPPPAAAQNPRVPFLRAQNHLPRHSSGHPRDTDPGLPLGPALGMTHEAGLPTWPLPRPGVGMQPPSVGRLGILHRVHLGAPGGGRIFTAPSPA